MLSQCTAWVGVGVADLALDAPMDCSVHSIFFGGGTPTLTEPETIQAVVEVCGSATDHGLH